MFSIGFLIHRASLARRNDLVSVGVKEASVQGQTPGTPYVAGEEIELCGLSIADPPLHGQGSPFGSPGQDVDHSSHRVVTIQVGVRTLDDLNLVNAEQGNAAPIHPSPERIVKRHTIQKHQGSAHAAGSDTPQRNSLTGRMCRQAAGAAEKTEGGNLAKHTIQRQCRRAVDLILVQHTDGSRQVSHPLLTAGGGDDDRFR